MKWQKIKSQKLHVPILETNHKNLHPQKKQLHGNLVSYCNSILITCISPLTISLWTVFSPTNCIYRYLKTLSLLTKAQRVLFITMILHLPLSCTLDLSLTALDLSFLRFSIKIFWSSTSSVNLSISSVNLSITICCSFTLF